MDINSFVDGYIIDELTNLSDRDATSFYIYYDSSDKLIHRGPIWDYDASIGNCVHLIDQGFCNPEYLCAKEYIEWYKLLLNFDEFNELVKLRLNEINNDNTFGNILNNFIEQLLISKSAFEHNFEKWDILGSYIEMPNGWANVTTDEIAEIDTWEGQVEYVEQWLLSSFDYMLSVYCS